MLIKLLFLSQWDTFYYLIDWLIHVGSWKRAVQVCENKNQIH